MASPVRPVVIRAPQSQSSITRRRSPHDCGSARSQRGACWTPSPRSPAAGSSRAPPARPSGAWSSRRPRSRNRATARRERRPAPGAGAPGARQARCARSAFAPAATRVRAEEEAAPERRRGRCGRSSHDSSVTLVVPARQIAELMAIGADAVIWSEKPGEVSGAVVRERGSPELRSVHEKVPKPCSAAASGGGTTPEVPDAPLVRGCCSPPPPEGAFVCYWVQCS